MEVLINIKLQKRYVLSKSKNKIIKILYVYLLILFICLCHRLLLFYCSELSFCAKAASRNGFHIFGLQFFGECWSGVNAAQTYAKDGPSNRCLMAVNSVELRECNDASHEACVGVEFTNYVYRIIHPGT